jgi:Uma2 family endonuclease
MRLSTSPRPPEADDDYFYPHSDGLPVGETPAHVRNLVLGTDILDAWFAGDPQVFVAGNMFIYYVPRNRRKHVSPDVFVVRGVPKDKPRKKYLLWEEGKGPDLVVELTSASTAKNDLGQKKRIYRDILGVREYVLFDPYGEYLKPALQGFLLQEGDDVPMPMVSGRLPSGVLGLHFEADAQDLRLYNPATGCWLRMPAEDREFAAQTAAKLAQTAAERDKTAAKLDQTAAKLDQTAAERDQTTAKLDQTTAKLDQTAAERDRLAAERDQAMAEKKRVEQELAELRRRLGEMGG